MQAASDVCGLKVVAEQGRESDEGGKGMKDERYVAEYLGLRLALQPMLASCSCVHLCLAGQGHPGTLSWFSTWVSRNQNEPVAKGDGCVVVLFVEQEYKRGPCPKGVR